MFVPEADVFIMDVQFDKEKRKIYSFIIEIIEY